MTTHQNALFTESMHEAIVAARPYDLAEQTVEVDDRTARMLSLREPRRYREYGRLSAAEKVVLCGQASLTVKRMVRTESGDAELFTDVIPFHCANRQLCANCRREWAQRQLSKFQVLFKHMQVPGGVLTIVGKKAENIRRSLRRAFPDAQIITIRDGDKLYLLPMLSDILPLLQWYRKYVGLASVAVMYGKSFFFSWLRNLLTRVVPRPHEHVIALPKGLLAALQSLTRKAREVLPVIGRVYRMVERTMSSFEVVQNAIQQGRTVTAVIKGWQYRITSQSRITGPEAMNPWRDWEATHHRLLDKPWIEVRNDV